MMRKATAETQQMTYFTISPLMIFPKTLGQFRVYIKQAGNYVLYAAAGEQFTPAHRQKLHVMGSSWGDDHRDCRGGILAGDRQQ